MICDTLYVLTVNDKCKLGDRLDLMYGQGFWMTYYISKNGGAGLQSDWFLEDGTKPHDNMDWLMKAWPRLRIRQRKAQV